MMKQMKENVDAKAKQAAPPPPPPPPPLPLQRFRVRENVVDSVTKQEIARFWRQKRIDEEDHLLAAIKAAARIRARNLSEEDYMEFEESLKEDDHDDGTTEKIDHATTNNSKESNTNNEVRIGIKDWWTKSKYAYLNQPAIGSSSSMDTPKNRTSTYIPNCFTYNNPVALYSTSLGVF